MVKCHCKMKTFPPLCALLVLIALVLFSALVWLILVWSDTVSLSEMQNVFLKPEEFSEFGRSLNPARTSLIDSNIIKVMISSQGGHLVGMIATINSIISNTVSPVFFYLVTSPDDAHHLENWISESKLSGISYVIRTLTEDQDSNRNLKLARLYIPVLFPDIEDMLIYIDDTCIIQGDIKHLGNVRPANGHFGVFSSDCSSVSKRFHLVSNRYSNYINFNNPKIKTLNMNPGTCSFNSGVFVANVTEWRLKNVIDRFLYWTQLNKNESILRNHLDNEGAEPLIMIVFYHKITYMDPMWNVRHLGVSRQSRFSSQFLQQAKLLQWDGPFKPWNRRASHTEFWERYRLPDPLQKFY